MMQVKNVKNTPSLLTVVLQNHLKAADMDYIRLLLLTLSPPAVKTQ
jgi:hypothetical protein